MIATRFALVGEDVLCCELGIALITQSGIAAEMAINQAAGGFGPFIAKISKMNGVALNVMPVLMIADGDQDNCVLKQRNAWIPANMSPRLALRLAVREAESWVLADHEGFTKFAAISKDLLPPEPEKIQDPKNTLLTLISRSKRRDLRNEMLPDKGSRALTGLGYNLHLREFVKQHWSAERAAQRAPSLARAIPRIAELLRM